MCAFQHGISNFSAGQISFDNAQIIPLNSKRVYFRCFSNQHFRSYFVDSISPVMPRKKFSRNDNSSKIVDALEKPKNKYFTSGSFLKPKVLVGGFLALIFLYAVCDSIYLKKKRQAAAASRSASESKAKKSFPPTGSAGSALAPVYTFEIENQYYHDPNSFTQGVIFYQDTFIESAGMYNVSRVYRYDAKQTEKKIHEQPLEGHLFSEGITYSQGELLQVTWKSGHGIVYDPDTLQPKSTFAFQGDGWGLTSCDDEKRQILYLSDGTSYIRKLDRKTFQQVGRFKVTDGNRVISMINELECIKGEIWANIWGSDLVMKFDKHSGQVIHWVHFEDLLHYSQRPPTRKPDVLNGIAHDPETNRIWVTGKYWPTLFQVKVVLEVVANTVEELQPYFIDEQRSAYILKNYF